MLSYCLSAEFPPNDRTKVDIPRAVFEVALNCLRLGDTQPGQNQRAKGAFDQNVPAGHIAGQSSEYRALLSCALQRCRCVGRGMMCCIQFDFKWVMHIYFSCSQLIGIIMENPLSLDTVPLLKEVFIAGAYASTVRSLHKDAQSLIHLLPLTNCSTRKSLQAKVGDFTIGISHETLHSTTMMLLSPQQRLSPYCSDIWTKLWERLNDNKKTHPRFSPELVAEKLLYSLACYQPEPLSRCTTPMSPCVPMSPMGIDFGTRRISQNSVLPFLEMEATAATKQEHVISVVSVELI